jgi:outer membrane protein
MKANISILASLGLGAALLASIAGAQTAPPAAAPAPSAAPVTPAVKVGVIDIQAAIIQTKDGQKAAAELKTKFSPKQSELEKKQQDIAGLQEQLRKGQNTMSEENKQKLMRDIDLKNTSLKRDTEDANADLEQEQQRIMGDLGGKMISVLNKYSTDNGYALVLDISSQQTPVLFASNTIDITREIIGLYDKTSPNFAAPTQQPRMTSPTGAPRPTTPTPPKPGTIKPN